MLGLAFQIFLELQWSLAVPLSHVWSLASSKTSAPSSWLLQECLLELENLKINAFCSFFGERSTSHHMKFLDHWAEQNVRR